MAAKPDWPPWTKETAGLREETGRIKLVAGVGFEPTAFRL